MILRPGTIAACFNTAKTPFHVALNSHHCFPNRALPGRQCYFPTSVRYTGRDPTPISLSSCRTTHVNSWIKHVSHSILVRLVFVVVIFLSSLLRFHCPHNIVRLTLLSSKSLSYILIIIGKFPVLKLTHLSEYVLPPVSSSPT